MPKQAWIKLAVLVALAAGVARAQDANTVIQNAQKSNGRSSIHPVLCHRQNGRLWTELASGRPVAFNRHHQLHAHD